jgi:hypothetical protein
MPRNKLAFVIVLTAAILMAAASANAGDWFDKVFGIRTTNGIEGSGDLVSEDRDVDEFTRIESSGPFDVVVTIGDKQSVSITFDDNLIDLVETNVRRKTLQIYSDENFDSEHSCRVEVTIPKLERVVTRGSGDITVESVSGKRFDCRVNGSGDIMVGELACDRVECSIHGSGDIVLQQLDGEFVECLIHGSGDFSAEGKVDEIEISIHGSGDVDTRDLRAQTADVTVQGSGDVRVHCEDSFDGAVYGSGDIIFYGDPKYISKHVSGSGSIRGR